jgi:hypothetical protein
MQEVLEMVRAALEMDAGEGARHKVVLTRLTETYGIVARIARKLLRRR